ncbi:catalase-related domain-containing protein [Sorangium sp. So ce542]|uniref:catalase-related domain-containing protein n=1 Tax=Sorangium sp. So ce542 TaxID=3133316 RepID=UPI003F60925D
MSFPRQARRGQPHRRSGLGHPGQEFQPREGKIFIESQGWCVLGGAGADNGRQAGDGERAQAPTCRATDTRRASAGRQAARADRERARPAADHRSHQRLRSAGERYRAFEPSERDDLMKNLVDALPQCDRAIQERMLGHLVQCDQDYGRRIAEGLSSRTDGSGKASGYRRLGSARRAALPARASSTAEIATLTL